MSARCGIGPSDIAKIDEALRLGLQGGSHTPGTGA